jgi:hypothetical protein
MSDDRDSPSLSVKNNLGKNPNRALKYRKKQKETKLLLLVSELFHFFHSARPPKRPNLSE